MSSNKRRKLNVPATPPRLSAVAARRALKSGTSSPKPAGSPNGNIKTEDSLVALKPERLSLRNTETASGLQDVPKDNFILQDAEVNTQAATGALTTDYSPSSSFGSRAESPEPVERLSSIPSIGLSNFKPNKDNIKELKDGILALRLAPGERLVILGQCELSIQSGSITLMGATLPSSQTRYRVSAPSSHSLPVIRCLGTDVNDAEIRLYQRENGLDSLKSLSPLFGKLWNDGSGALGPEYQSMLQKIKTSTFQILFSSKDEPQRAYLQPLISPPEWNEILSKSSTPTGHKTSTIMICGPKSSGKSTFTRLLVNRILSSIAPDTKSPTITKLTGVAVLDLDPGQPEYSPSGQLTLIHVQELNFGQPFSHPVPDGKSTVIRSHAIGAISPSLDPSLYVACALDLFAHYRNLLQTLPGCPLIINTPGWVLGTGLEILLDLIAKARPTEIIYMSTEGPWDVVQSLREEAKLISVITLPSQASEYTTRTAAHLRTMQNMSYFHLDSNTKQETIWNGQPLTSIPPWEIRYSGENAGILGVLCYGEQPPAGLLAETINGSLVAVVVIDDLAAIPGWDTEGENTINEDGDLEITNPEFAERDGEIKVYGEDSLHPGHLERPIIIRTPVEDLPYFNPANTISLDPKYSHSIGLALVRGIDVTRRRIQVLTPIPSKQIEEINEAGKSIVLVSGKLNTPGWAYTEELNQKTALGRDSRDQEIMNLGEEGDGGDDGESVDIEGTDGSENQRSRRDGFQNAPWIEKLEGSQGRGIGSRVWRVRRDLGRGGEGGD